MRRSSLTLAFPLLVAVAMPSVVRAQGVDTTAVKIPKEMMPPAGKCRIWIPGVPASQQAAPTDCTTALRQKPTNGVLVFGAAKRDLSPYDPRNPWAPSDARERAARDSARRAQQERDEARRGTVPRTDSRTASRPSERETPTRGGDARRPTAERLPSSQGGTASSREPTPPPKQDPPPPKKPEQS